MRPHPIHGALRLLADEVVVGRVRAFVGVGGEHEAGLVKIELGAEPLAGDRRRDVDPADTARGQLGVEIERELAAREIILVDLADDLPAHVEDRQAELVAELSGPRAAPQVGDERIARTPRLVGAVVGAILSSSFADDHSTLPVGRFARQSIFLKET